MSRRHRSRHKLVMHSASSQSDRWMVSYADFITLLMAFFVVMYSVSQVNESKYRMLSDTLMQSFSSSGSAQPDVPAVVQPPDFLLMDLPDAQQKMPDADSEAGISSEYDSVKSLHAKSTSEKFMQEDALHQPDLGELAAMLRREFEPLINEEMLFIQGNDTQLEVTLGADVLFDSGKAAPKESAQRLFFDMANTLKRTRGTISIEGHTDNVPVVSEVYPSNWELSAARAAAIVKALEGYGIDPARLTVVGHGEYQPVGSNVTAKSRMKNRRVVLVIHRATIERPTLTLEQLNIDSGSNSAGN